MTENKENKAESHNNFEGVVVSFSEIYERSDKQKSLALGGVEPLIEKGEYVPVDELKVVRYAKEICAFLAKFFLTSEALRIPNKGPRALEARANILMKGLAELPGDHVFMQAPWFRDLKNVAELNELVKRMDGDLETLVKDRVATLDLLSQEREKSAGLEKARDKLAGLIEDQAPLTILVAQLKKDKEALELENENLKSEKRDLVKISNDSDIECDKAVVKAQSLEAALEDANQLVYEHAKFLRQLQPVKLPIPEVLNPEKPVCDIKDCDDEAEAWVEPTGEPRQRLCFSHANSLYREALREDSEDDTAVFAVPTKEAVSQWQEMSEEDRKALGAGNEEVVEEAKTKSASEAEKEQGEL